jgi:putative membrane protein
VLGQKNEGGDIMHFLATVVRFVVAALVLIVTDWFVPGFDVGGFWSALFLAVVISVVAWIIEGIFGRKINPFGRGIVGFLTSALVIWLGQFIVSNVETTVIGAILAALVIGIIDLFIPVSTPFDATGKDKGERVK